VSGRTTAGVAVALLVGWFARVAAELSADFRDVATLALIAALLGIAQWLDRGDPVDPWKRAADEQDDP
jgi:hypothetical protein